MQNGGFDNEVLKNNGYLGPKLGTVKLSLDCIEDKAMFFYQLINQGMIVGLDSNTAVNTAVNFVTLFKVNVKE